SMFVRVAIILLPSSFLFVSFVFLLCSGDHRFLRSFPTRRSSDLCSPMRWARLRSWSSPSSPAGAPGSWTADPDVTERHPRSICRSEEHTSELQSRFDLVCRLLLEKKNIGQIHSRYNDADDGFTAL